MATGITHQFDLNIEPSIEDDTPIDMEPQPTQEETNINIVNHFLFDLNIEPNVEDDTPIDMELQATQEETNINIDDGITTNEELRQPYSRQSRELTNGERTILYEILLKKSVDGKLTKGVKEIVASIFSVSQWTVQRIWKQAGYGTGHNVSHRKTKNCGRKRIQIDVDRFRGVPLSKRKTLRSLASSLEMSISTLYLCLKAKEICRHTNAIKPFLTEENRLSRLRFCLSMVHPESIPHDPFFKDMYNTVHIDENGFYMTKKSERYYLLPSEEKPVRSCKSKNFIGKVMFLCAVARPRFDAEGRELFSGKIGIYPLVTVQAAKRSSSNRAAGTLVTKPITKVNRDVIRSFLIEKVVPSIKEKWPRHDSIGPIFIQQDNARTHVNPDDEEFRQVATSDGFDIRLICQPANSPDLNILDLGFFSAIQSIQHEEPPKTIDDLIGAVVNAYDSYPTVKSNRIFLTLQSCMVEIMRARSSNNYSIPHIKKAMLEKEGQLPTVLRCDSGLINDVINYLGTDM